ncbi:HNH endonuclease [Nitriliruptoraceae bacterium ZYF776]|nr:HNH endonuclease [Profundirhabdus halotolerans]
MSAPRGRGDGRPGGYAGPHTGGNARAGRTVAGCRRRRSRGRSNVPEGRRGPRGHTGGVASRPPPGHRHHRPATRGTSVPLSAERRRAAPRPTRTGRRRGALAGAVSVVALVVALLVDLDVVARTSAAAPVPETVTTDDRPSSAAEPVTSAEAPAPHVHLPTGDELDRGDAPPLPDAPLDELLERLDVDDLGSPTGAYDRALFPHWDRTVTGCTAREDVLRRDLVGAELDDRGCRPIAGTGTLVSAWDGEVVDDPAAIDVDHLVALADAYGAGASTWPAEQRRTFANDPANLLAVTAASNRAKAAHGPDRWLPATGPEVTCWYLDRYARVRVAYELSVTTDEHDALVAASAAC